MSVLDTSKDFNKYFEEIAAIPRGSFKEERISKYLEDFAIAHKLAYKRDTMNNIIIYKSASRGYESHSAVMLQGHMDMVNEKNQESTHDFDTDPLDLYVKDGFLKARGTTLGADDGCGVAYMLSILADTTLKHPPLDCVFTVQEEVGLLGAMHIKAEAIRARRMIGLDSGNENSVCISSSGGRSAVIRKEIVFIENMKATYRVFVSGLLGGHSGRAIDKERGNANKIAMRAMYHLSNNDIDIYLVKIHGGLKDNAICRECEVIFNSSTSLTEIKKVIAQVQAEVASELAFSDAGVSITVEEYAQQNYAISLEQSKEIIQIIYILPNGFIHKSMAIPNLTTVSLNLGVIRTGDSQIKIYYSIRSPMQSAKEELSNQLFCIATVFNASCEVKNDYPGWHYEKDSLLREQYLDYVEKTEKKRLDCEATHVGLETGIFKGILPELDILTLGPDMYDIHTPDERLSLASFEKCYYRLVKFLEIL